MKSEDQLIIALELPSEVKEKLSGLCQGLPFVTWLEKADLHLPLFQIQNPLGNTLLDIQETLSQIHKSEKAVHIVLKGIECIQEKRRGHLRVKVEESIEIQKMKNRIKKSLADNNTTLSNKQNQVLNIPLGQFDELDEWKMAFYLETYSLFTSPPIKLNALTLLLRHPTDKKILYIKKESYILS